MIKAIPAKDIVSVIPGVLDSGGSPLALNGVILSTNSLIPQSKILTFTSKAAVGSYFGLASSEYELAGRYFGGFSNSTIKPATLFFAAYAGAARGAFMMFGAGMTLAQVKAVASGTLTISIDGVSKTTASINLSGAASHSAAAALIQTSLQLQSGWGTVTCTYVSSPGVYIITSPTTGSASAINYASGTFATAMKMTQATGAILSQGLAVDTPAVAMGRVVSYATNWALFMTMWEPDAAAKELFRDWANGTDQRYGYVAWSADSNAIISGASTTFGATTWAGEYNGTFCISVSENCCAREGTVAADTARTHAAFALGAIASVDYSRVNSRVNFAFKTQSGLPLGCDDSQEGANLLANGYNFVARYGTDNDQFVFLYDGRMAGQWKSLTRYVNQIWMNAQFQLAEMTLLTSVKSVPYNDEGYALIRAAMMDVIIQAKRFGAIQPGVSLSELQKAELNRAAGTDIDQTLETEGWYLQVLDPGAQVRGNGGSPIINFWYTDGGDVLKINIASIDVI
jgi:hypothetical protein